MRDIKRGAHIDFHTMPGIYNIGQGFDAKIFAERLANAHIDYVNFFASCNLGFTYYPTKIGIPYPGLNSDMFGDVLNECHARDIGVSGYINIGLMHEHARKNPHWCRVDKDGKIIRGDRDGNFFRTMCYNSKGYRTFLLTMIKEICEYDIDGLFCDCIHFFPCLCNKCTEDMIAEGIDITDDNAVLEFDKKVVMDICSQIKKINGSNRYLYLNGMPGYDYRDLNTHIEVECLPSSDIWDYDYFWSHAAYARNIKNKVFYMTGRFQKCWGDFGGYKTKTSIENDFYDGLCNNCLPFIGDHMHPAENLVADIYKDIGLINEKIIQYEKYTLTAKYKSDIGVITDSPGFLKNDYHGLARMLGELKLSFDIIHQDMDFNRFPLVILPDNMIVNENLKNKLRTYIDNGGKILSSGFGGLIKTDSSNLSFEFSLPEYDAVINGSDSSNSPYFTFINLPEGSADMPWSMYEEGICMTSNKSENVRAKYIKPYFNKKWDGLHGYFYCPPEKETEHAAAIYSGNVAHICFRIFEAYYNTCLREHKLLVKQLVDELLPKPLLKTQSGIPSTARVTVTGTDDYTLLHVKSTFPEPRGKMDIIEEHVILKEGAVVSVRGKYNSVYLLPNETPVKSVYENGYTTITLPEINGYEMFLLK